MTAERADVASLLVVDDTLENLRLLGNMLGEEGYEVRPVSSGRQALQAVEHDPPDLILLDVNMPEMDGYEVCRRVRASAQSGDVPVIFLTAWTDRAYMVKAFDVGGTDYVTKPFFLEEVLARVKTHIGLRRARQALTEREGRIQALEQLHRELGRTAGNVQSTLKALTCHLDRLKERQLAALDPEARATLDAAIEAAASIRRISSPFLEATEADQG